MEHHFFAQGLGNFFLLMVASSTITHICTRYSDTCRTKVLGRTSWQSKRHNSLKGLADVLYTGNRRLDEQPKRYLCLTQEPNTTSMILLVFYVQKKPLRSIMNGSEPGLPFKLPRRSLNKIY